MRRIQGWLAAGGTALFIGAAALAADGGGRGATTRPADSQPAPSAEEVREKMMGQMRQNPLIEPSQRRGNREETAAPTGESMRIGVDANIIGSAPGATTPSLRNEGEFVVNRRGRLSRAPDGSHRVFIFDADAQHSPEAPMILSPCVMLQSMEDLTEERGDRIRFNVSGQVLQYRGANYLLVTMYVLAEDRGNLQK